MNSYFKSLNLSTDIDSFILQIPKNGCIFLCNPNNPTGELLSKKELLSIILKAKKLKTLVFIDECFIELVPDSNESVISYVKKHDNLSTIEGRSKVAQFAVPLVDKIVNPTLREAYISEIAHICDLDFGKLLNGVVNTVPENVKQEEPAKKVPTSVIRKSVLGVFTALIQYPKLANERPFDLIKQDSKFLFLNVIRDFYKENPTASPSILFEQIENEKIKNLFGEALVSEIKLTEENAKKMLSDCIEIISKSEKDRQETLKEKYNMQEITSSEKRELQQIILKKDEISEEDIILLKNLSSK